MIARKILLLAGAALGALCSPLSGSAEEVELPMVTVSRTGAGIVGASTTVITAQDIERSPGTTVQDVLTEQAGVQAISLFGGVNGVQTSVDLRGFGVFAAQNTLVMINGRRINDLDLDRVDFSVIPKASIERIEITRGNSGAVLYGDNAVGGVINIVTKSAVGAPPSARIEGGFGSFNYREGSASASGSRGPWSVSVVGNAIESDGYRRHNELKERSGVGELRYDVDGFSAFVTATGDDQKANLPGARRVDALTGLNQVASDPRGATTPFNYADKQTFSVTAGFTRQIADGFELVVDGGLRQKKQQAAFFGNFVDPSASDPMNYVDTTLTIASLTPRVNHVHGVFGVPMKSTVGLDVYNADYDSARSLAKGSAPIHRYALTQRTVAFYGQNTMAVTPDTDLSFGARGQYFTLQARDRIDVTAPGACPFGFCEVQATALDKTEVQHALHAGLEHRLSERLAIFGRLARSFRTPNVDERIGVASFPVNFDIKTQTSYDGEVGLRINAGRLAVQSSVYDMRLTNELHFIPFPPLGADTNLDPTRRWGSETHATYRLTDAVRFKGNVTYTRATFREGMFAGREVPLVPRWMANAGFSWDVWQKWLTIDALVRHVGPRVMDNDQANVQPRIRGRTTADIRIGGDIGKFYWSFAVQNIFNLYYFDYAVASPTVIGTYNAYPLPGRTFMARAGVKL